MAVELKKGEFKPIYLGQLNLYLQVLDDTVKKSHENPSVGIILCQSADKPYVEYAIRDYNKPLGVATFRTADEMPENLSAWLQGYGEEMEWAKTSAAGGPMKVSAQVNAKARPAVSPLLRTVWNQHEPYNLKCFNTSGYQALTGCTTLAIAQVMYYYRWPQGKTAVIPAYKYSDALPATTFDWDHIKDTYSKNLGIDTEEEKEAVSKMGY